MKISKKIAALLLAVLLIASLAACGEDSTQSKMDALVGTWKLNEYFDADNTQAMLEYFGFDDEELEYADLEGVYLVKLLILNEDKSYSMEYDVDASEAALRSYVDDYIGKLYEQKDNLTAIYGDEINECETLEDFQSFYAWLYDYDTYEDYLDAVVDGMSEGMELSDNVSETGVFQIKDNTLEMKVDGESEYEYVDYAIDGSQLSIEYSNTTEVYTKA